ncbi:SGNH/GDSL hydrolase family protein [Streptomyces sp. NPDC086787]|uniref:SGNH/GDSL hydrolase family protein n=1 Tax=Streptomyces sp. NPDC086787 TaxID=3365759 RepID=UPI00380E03DB
MTTRPPALLAGLLLTAGALAAYVGIARDGGARDAGPADSRTRYAAVGDSFTSGVGIPRQSADPAGCGRSDHNYPALVAAGLGLTADDFRDVSCSGAAIADLTAPQITGGGSNPAQFGALSPATRLVTIGIGSNDLDLIGMIMRCVTDTTADAFLGTGGGSHRPEPAPCRGQYVEGGTDHAQERIAAAGGRLSDALREVRRRAPGARVLVVGYPAIMPADSSACGLELPLARGDITFLREKEQQLDATLRERARAAGADFVDTYTPSREHNACSAAGTRWVEPLQPSGPAAALHPNARGERGMAAEVLRAVNSAGHLG